VRADPFNRDDPRTVGHAHLEPAGIAFHVEDDDAFSNEAGGSVAAADVMRRQPSRGFDCAQPVFQPLAGVRMLAGELVEPLTIEYFPSSGSLA